MASALLAVRPHPELWPFLAPRRRREVVEVGHDPDATVGHVVQSLGIPLTEVGPLAVDGAGAGPAHRPRPGARIDVGPVSRPQRVPGATGFLLDVHLGTLARRLRVLGVDAAYRNPADDDALVRQAATEQRVLLTRDRGLLMRRALWAGAHVRGDRPADQLADVLDRFAPALDPWTRCPACNGLLDEVAKADVADRLEPGTRRCYERFARCRACDRVFWHGAHGRGLDAVVAAARAQLGTAGRPDGPPTAGGR
ncbi:hypothetical protein H7X46_10660 [Pseudonocardia sp. C8]|uniref:Mut7-C RNAse domain-containing protein n=1 Tax=Pseudonocardia sp. C8 TaxID=2762759 RepID=UPI0016430CE3|nr:Mut7-C RNAse domain-containing protein [Pseudonocardia sp. C8]MBC3191523.1 hypothetical protein [Pseudonocardia sp. C8]